MEKICSILNNSETSRSTYNSLSIFEVPQKRILAESDTVYYKPPLSNFITIH